MAILIPLICIVLILLIGKYHFSRRHLYKYAKKISGLPGTLPILGDALRFTRDDVWKIRNKVQEFYNEDGLLKIWLGNKLIICARNPECVRIVLNNYLEKDDSYKFLTSIFGNGLVTSEVSTWKKHRKIMSPTMCQKNLNEFAKTFIVQSEIFVQNLSSKIGKEEIDVRYHLQKCSMDMVCQTIIGTDKNTQEKEFNSFFNDVSEGCRLFFIRIKSPWLFPDFIFNLSKYGKSFKDSCIRKDFFLENIINKTLSNMKTREDQYEDEDCPRQKNLLERLVEAQGENKFTVKDLKDESYTMIITGYDSSAITECHTLAILGCLPHIQEKVMEELNEIYGNTSRSIDVEDLPKMKYLERVIMEILRLFPIVPLITRKITSDFKYGKYTIPAGCTFAVDIYKIHTEEKLWGKNAKEFDPDRFLPENSKNRHPYSFLPFSEGPRNCIGQKYAIMAIKTMLATVLRKYKVSSTLDFKNIEINWELVMFIKNGTTISLENRENL